MRRSLFALLLLPMFLACDEDTVGPETDNSHVGVYQLQSVNGDDVPVSIEEDGGIFTMLGASVTLNANGTFSMAAQMQFTIDGETTPQNDALSGTYTRAGNTVTFEHGGDDVGFETATLSGDVLTTAGGGDEVLVFEK